MKALTVALFIAGVGLAGTSLAGLAPAKAMSVAPLGQNAGTEMVVRVAKACKRGYQLTPKGCRKIKSR